MTFKNVNPKTTNIAAEGNPYPFDEMHLNVTNISPDTIGTVTIHNSDIQEIQFYNKINYKQKNATTAVTTAGIGVGVTILISIGGIALISATIALFVSIFNIILSGDKTVFYQN